MRIRVVLNECRMLREYNQTGLKIGSGFNRLCAEMSYQSEKSHVPVEILGSHAPVMPDHFLEATVEGGGVEQITLFVALVTNQGNTLALNMGYTRYTRCQPVISLHHPLVSQTAEQCGSPEA